MSNSEQVRLVMFLGGFIGAAVLVLALIALRLRTNISFTAGVFASAAIGSVGAGTFWLLAGWVAQRLEP